MTADSGSDALKPKRSPWSTTLKVIGGLALICCMLVLYTIWHFRRDDLTLKADRVIPLPHVTWYSWIDQENLLLCKYNKEVSRFSTVTRVSTPNSYLTQVMKTPSVTFPDLLSPTGSALLILSVDRKNDVKMGVIRLDGSAPVRWTESKGFAWLDSESLIALNGDSSNVTLDKYTTQGVKSVLRRVTTEGSTHVDSSQGLLGVFHDTAIGVTRDITAVAEGKIYLTHINIRDNSPAKVYSVSPPESGQILDVSISPGGDKLIWLFWTKPINNSSLMATLYRRLGLLSKDAAMAKAWVSDAQGKGFRYIGRVGDSAERPALIPSALRWSPDGSHLSLHYNDRLYMIESPK